jgi:hypothetical protein
MNSERKNVDLSEQSRQLSGGRGRRGDASIEAPRLKEMWR